jgi:CsoR family transcriptional regulator, copper-sensing transcriptional repressor
MKSKDKKDKKKTKLDKLEQYTPNTSHADETKRLNRIIGQIEGISKMLESSRKLDDVLIQCKAVHSALRAVELRVARNYLDQALSDIANMDKKKSREQKLAELEDIFKQISERS